MPWEGQGTRAVQTRSRGCTYSSLPLHAPTQPTRPNPQKPSAMSTAEVGSFCSPLTPHPGPASVPGWGDGSPRISLPGREAHPALRLGRSRCRGTALCASAGVRPARKQSHARCDAVHTVRVGTLPNSTTRVSESRVGCPVTGPHCPRRHREVHNPQENSRQAEAKTESQIPTVSTDETEARP